VRESSYHLTATVVAMVALPLLVAASTVGSVPHPAGVTHPANSRPRGSARKPGGASGGATIGNLEVTVPAVAFGPSDGLPAALVRGSTYRTELVALATPGVGDASVMVSARGGTITCDGIGPLTDGVSDHLGCLLRPGRSNLVTLDLTVTTDAGRYATRFTHTVLSTRSAP
jgi:hypothetical protein